MTFGAGEGGGGFGDSINLRGFTASNDIMVDGVRDSAQYTRSDPFNLQQVEIINGANSVYGGAGSVGGSINLVSKRPEGRDVTSISAGVGTDNYGRVTLDANKSLGGGAAFRLNAMAHTNDVPGRDVESNKRWGIAPSLTLGLEGPTQLTFLYAHQKDDNTPQYGVPYALNAFNNGSLGADPSDYFGYRNIDTQESTVDAITAIVEHRFNDSVSLRNLSRYEKATQYLVVDPPQGTFCLATGINPYTGAACAARDTYIPSGPRGNVRDTTNDILVNQTDVTAHFETGVLRHTFVGGVSFSKETYELKGASVLRNALGQTFTLPTTSISNPNSLYTGQQIFTPTSSTDSEVRNSAIYAFDRAEIGKYWEINGGVRFERNEGRALTTAIAYNATTGVPTTTVNPLASNDDDLFSYRAGLVFKPIENASLYFAYGNSVTPSQSTVNGGCTVVATATAGSNCNLDPEEARSYEFGGKWSTMNGGLLLTAAIFRNERTNFRVSSGDPTVPQQQLDGSSKVDGLALGATGLITENWAVYANYTYLDSEIEQSISTLAIGGGALDFQKGDPLPVTPKHSASFWTTYVLPHKFTVGYGASYQGEYTFNRVSGQPLFYTPDYWVHRAMVSYEFMPRAVIQLNVNNLFDEEYYTRIRNNATSGWATPGDARNAVLSLNYRY
ncbi:MAG: TonB-dependent siderophore receptor [Alphaproteobacteria bacterium]